MDEHGRQPNPRYLDGNKLRAAMVAAALSPAELADKVGIDRSHVAHHLAGSYGCRMKLLRKYAEALGVEPKALMLDSALTSAGTEPTAKAAA